MTSRVDQCRCARPISNGNHLVLPTVKYGWLIDVGLGFSPWKLALHSGDHHLCTGRTRLAINNQCLETSLTARHRQQ